MSDDEKVSEIMLKTYLKKTSRRGAEAQRTQKEYWNVLDYMKADVNEW